VTHACEEIRLELGGYALGGLTADERQLVETHAATCARCRAELDELMATSRVLTALGPPTPPAPADLHHRVLAAHRRGTRRHPTWLVAAAVLLTALVGVAIGIVLQASDRQPSPDAVLALEGAAAGELSGEAGLRQTPNGVAVDLELVGVEEADEGYYHLWLHREDRRVSAGTFIGADREARAQLFCGGQLDDYDRLTVTWHPFGEDGEVVAIDAGLR
jgi:anti-sigma-K factor RskA